MSLDLVYGPIAISLFAAGGELLRHLGRKSVPRLLEPLATRWVESGYDARWVQRALWAVFWMIAVGLAVFIAIPLYDVVIDLGTA
jgi:hypothetical protein